MRAIAVPVLGLLVFALTASSQSPIGYYDITAVLSNQTFLVCNQCYYYGSTLGYYKASCNSDATTMHFQKCTDDACTSCTTQTTVSGWSNVTASTVLNGGSSLSRWMRIKKNYRCSTNIQVATYSTLSGSCSGSTNLAARVYYPLICYTSSFSAYMYYCDGTSASLTYYVSFKSGRSCNGTTSQFEYSTAISSTGCGSGYSNIKCLYPSSGLCVLMESTRTDMSASSNSPSSVAALSTAIAAIATVLFAALTF